MISWSEIFPLFKHTRRARYLPLSTASEASYKFVLNISSHLNFSLLPGLFLKCVSFQIVDISIKDFKFNFIVVRKCILYHLNLSKFWDIFMCQSVVYLDKYYSWVFLFVYYFLNFIIFNSYMRSQTWTPLPPPSHNKWVREETRKIN